MEGVVLGYESEEGVIKGADGARYRFGISDWKSPRGPVAGVKVDFVPEDGQAREIYLVNPATGAVIGAMDSIEKSEKSWPMAVYICYLAAFLYGFTIIVGVIIAYLKRGDATGTWYRSHYDYQISMFWKSLIGVLVGIATIWAFGLGAIILICTYIWVIFKSVKGLLLLSDGKEVNAKEYRWPRQQ